MTSPQFPDPLGIRQPLSPGATNHVAGPALEERVAALERGALGIPPSGTANGCVPTADSSQAGGAKWSGAQAVSVYRSTSFSHNASGSYLVLTWDGEHFDTNGLHSTSSNTERLVAAVAGYYQVSATVEWDGHTTGDRISRIGKVASGVTTYHARVGSTGVTNGTAHTLSTLVYLAVGDYVFVDGWQNSGGTRTITAGAATNGASIFGMAQIR